jgi:outer membrane lipoprotein SlyB
MNTTTSPNDSRSTASGIHRGVWIGGGLMALTIIALATTLVVKKNDALPDPAAGMAATTVAATTTPSSTTSPTTSEQPAATPVPVNESTRPVHHATAPVHHQTQTQTQAQTAHDAEPQQVAAAAPVCATCGVIDSYSAVKVQGQNNGVGAVAGGLGGALVGSKIAGRGNHTLGGVVGAIGGGLLGNAIESHERTTTAYDVRVRMADGSIRTVRQATLPTVGQRVNVDGHTLHPIDGQG